MTEDGVCRRCNLSYRRRVRTRGADLASRTGMGSWSAVLLLLLLLLSSNLRARRATARIGGSHALLSQLMLPVTPNLAVRSQELSYEAEAM
jgi:hypothetical protein